MTMGYVDREEWIDQYQEHLDFEAGAENTELAFLRREAHEDALREAAMDAQEMAEEARREAAIESMEIAQAEAAAADNDWNSVVRKDLDDRREAAADNDNDYDDIPF